MRLSTRNLSGVFVRALAAVAFAGALMGCNSSSPTAPLNSVTFTSIDLTVGTGATATNGSLVTIDYVAWLYTANTSDHKSIQIDSTATNGPVQFTAGAGTVIVGLDVGVVGMKVGGMRRLIVPSNFAFGPTGNGIIPPNAALVFDVTLDGVQ